MVLAGKLSVFCKKLLRFGLVPVVVLVGPTAMVGWVGLVLVVEVEVEVDVVAGVVDVAGVVVVAVLMSWSASAPQWPARWLLRLACWLRLAC
jgi:hypothetical protein